MGIRLLSLLILLSFTNSVIVDAQGIRGRRDAGGNIVLKREINLRHDRKIFTSSALILQDNEYEMFALSYNDTLTFKIASDVDVNGVLYEYKPATGCDFYYNIWLGGCNVIDCRGETYTVDRDLGNLHNCNVLHLISNIR